jgi:hypothetical protein
MNSLKEKVAEISVDKKPEIPRIVRLLENPSSPIALPGSINLYNHDCLHVLLAQDMSPRGYAFVVGFCMGNDYNTHWLHTIIFKLFSLYIYPQKFRLSFQEFASFDVGFEYGRKIIPKKRINRIDFSQINEYSVAKIRQIIGIREADLKILSRKIKFKNYRIDYQNYYWKKTVMQLAKVLKWSSSTFAVAGGVLLALNIEASPYAFFLLAASSFQLLLSSCLDKDKSLIVYSGSLFFCVDLLGIYRWILK